MAVVEIVLIYAVIGYTLGLRELCIGLGIATKDTWNEHCGFIQVTHKQDIAIYALQRILHCL